MHDQNRDEISSFLRMLVNFNSKHESFLHKEIKKINKTFNMKVLKAMEYLWKWVMTITDIQGWTLLPETMPLWRLNKGFLCPASILETELNNSFSTEQAKVRPESTQSYQFLVWIHFLRFKKATAQINFLIVIPDNQVCIISKVYHL